MLIPPAVPAWQFLPLLHNYDDERWNPLHCLEYRYYGVLLVSKIHVWQHIFKEKRLMPEIRMSKET